MPDRRMRPGGAPVQSGCVICVASTFFLIGFGVTIQGIAKLVEAQTRDVNKDFELLSSASDGTYCVIDSWQSSREGSCDSEGHCSCEDKYRFEFCLPSGCAITYESKQASKNVCSNRCSSCHGASRT